MQPHNPLMRAWTTATFYLFQAMLSPTAQRYTFSIALVVLTILGLHLSGQYDLFKLGFSALSLLNKVPFGEPWPT